MKLAYPEWNQLIEFQENQIPVIVIEDEKYYREIILEISEQILTARGRFVLSEGDNILALDKKSYIVHSPFVTDYEDSRLLKRIYKELEEVATGEEYLNTQEVSAKIEQYVYKLSDYLDYDITIDSNIDLQSVFKSAGIKLAYDDTDLITRFVDYLCLLHGLMGIDLFISVGMRSFFRDDELMEIYKTLAHNKINLLLLENRINNEIIPYERILTIDSDLCEI